MLKRFIHLTTEMYEDSSVDVIYITTPHNTHYEFIRQSLLHGKHVLAEKSITLNSSELNKLLKHWPMKRALFWQKP